MISSLKKLIVRKIKKLFKIEDLSLWLRKRRQNIESLLYRQQYNAIDILNIMISQGLKPGDTIVIHCAMNNFYNYKGTAKELIDTILSYLGDDGTLCMPSYPFNKTDNEIPFDLKNDKSAAGLLSETFRNYPNVRRSINKLHSVCALGKNAEYLTKDHQYSITCFDEFSPYYRLAELNGKSFALGLPSYFIGTVGHVCESILRLKSKYFKSKFIYSVPFKYICEDGRIETHNMLTGSVVPYIKRKSTKFVDDNFDKQFYSRKRLSNIYINMFDANYCVKRMTELALEGKTQYRLPIFYK